MTDKASAGWLVRIRAWGDPDEYYAAAIPDSRQAEEQVRDAAQPGAQAKVEAVRELSQDEMDKLEPGKIVRAKNS